jgi:hypothetical protein
MGKLLLWETEFFAVSVLTGDIKSYRGIFIQSDSISNALKQIRGLGFDYLQLTGNHYNSFEEVLMTDDFYEKLTNPKNIVEGMSFDEFMDWLELGASENDLLSAKKAFEKEEGMEEYIKIIDMQIKLKYGDKKDNKEEDNNTEEMG